MNKPHTTESKLKMSLAQKGALNHNFGKATWNKGLKGYTNAGSFEKGVSPSPKTQFKKGQPSWNNGKPAPWMIRVGEKSNLWKGGVSFESYPVDWTKTLRRSIRERDYYTCQVCKEPQGDTALDVHHIDYDKKNCNPENLISLCNSCHSKTNFNRDLWKEYFLSGGRQLAKPSL